MFHNYVVQYTDSARLISVEATEKPEFLSKYGVNRLCYSGKHDIYFNQQLHLQGVENFKINADLIIIEWDSEIV